MRSAFLQILVHFACLSVSVGSPIANSGDTLKVNIAASKVYWKGTKMFGVGKHEGEVALVSGYFVVKNDIPVSGNFVMDMKNLTVTDIPKTDPVPIKKLNNHLKSKDFFDVENHPAARFTFSSVKQIHPDSLQISGTLTLRGISNPIVFRALKKRSNYQARLKIDRFKWNVGYTGSWADKTLVDRDIELNIVIETDMNVRSGLR